MTYVGQSLKRFEDHQLLAGGSSYVDDMKLPGMVHALVLRSPHAHARIRSIDTSAASQSSGVVAVFTADDLASVVENLPTSAGAGADFLTPPPHPVLAKDKVCYVGQAVAIVVAETPESAREGIEQVLVDYEPLTAVVDPMQAVQAGTTVVHPELGTNVVLESVNAGGDMDEAFKQADRVVRERFHVQRLAPAPMEPRGLVADYQPAEDVVVERAEALRDQQRDEGSGPQAGCASSAGFHLARCHPDDVSAE